MVRELVVSWIRGQWRWLYLHSEKSHGGQKGKMSLAGRPWESQASRPTHGSACRPSLSWFRGHKAEAHT